MTYSETLIFEAKSVPTTNTLAERDFGMLDRLMRSKPKALDIVYEGIIMFKLNKTKQWRHFLNLLLSQRLFQIKNRFISKRPLKRVKCKKLSKRNNETGNVSKRKASGIIAASKKAKKCQSIKQAKSSNLSKIPIISSPVDLVGKIVFLFTER